MPSVQCPLEPTQFFNALPREGLHRLHILEDIEAHVSSNNSNCHHPPLKDLVFEGTTSLILACHYGHFDWVKRIVEHWSVDVNAAITCILIFVQDPRLLERLHCLLQRSTGTPPLSSTSLEMERTLP